MNSFTSITLFKLIPSQMLMYHHLGILLKYRSDSVNLGWSLRVCLSNKLPGDAKPMVLERTSEFLNLYIPATPYAKNYHYFH